jgi:hypothetical protein
VWGCSITLLLLALLLHFTAAFYYTLGSTCTTPKREHSAYSLGAQEGLFYYFTTRFNARFTATFYYSLYYTLERFRRILWARRGDSSITLLLLALLLALLRCILLLNFTAAFYCCILLHLREHFGVFFGIGGFLHYLYIYIVSKASSIYIYICIYMLLYTTKNKAVVNPKQ